MREMTSLESVALIIFQAIFSDQLNVEIEDHSYRIYKTKTGLRKVSYEGVWFIEQNPQKGSQYAQMAREGHQILWGLRNRTYILRIVDGVFTQLRS